MASLPRMIAQRLEGSRFGVYPGTSRIRLSVKGRTVRPTVGSRELPIASQVYGRIRTNQNALDENIALGYSREPPLATFFGRMGRWNEYRGVDWHAPKRLPSRRWEQTRLVNVRNAFDDENE